MKKNITTLKRGAKKLWTLGTLLLLSFAVNAQEVYVYFSTYPSSRGTLTVGSETGLSDYEADLTVGTTITVVAVTNDGSEFVRWEDNGVTLQAGEGNETLVYEVPNDGDDHEITAVFQALVPKYDVSAVVIPSEAGTVVAGTGRITSGNGTTLTVEDNSNYNGYYHYDGWSLSPDPEVTMQTTTHNYYFVVTENTTAYAHYSYIAHNVALTVESNNSALGSVKINYGGQDRGTSYDVTELQDFTLVATANPNVSFSGWYLVDGENEVFKSNQASYTTQFPQFSNSSCTYRAKFVNNSDPSLTCSVFTITEGGNPSGSNTGLTYNAPVTIHANKAANYSFIGWYEDMNQDGNYTDDELVSDLEDYLFNITRNVQYGAKYRHDDWTITITNDENKGTLSTEASFTVEHNSPVTIDVTAADGYRFNGWTGSVTSSDAHFYLAHVTDNLNLTTNYIQTYQFNATANNGGTVNVTPGNGTHDIHSSITATATPESDNYLFSHWTITGAEDNTDNPFEVNDLTQDYEIVANFVPTHRLSLSASTTSANAVLTITNNTTGWSGTYNPTTTYKFAEGDNITVSVQSFNNVHWGFVCWKNAGSGNCFVDGQDGEVIIDNENDIYTFTFTLTEDRDLQASFTNLTVTYPVTVSFNPIDGGSVSINGVTLVENQASVTDGLNTSLTATPNSGYIFDYWMINGVRHDGSPLNYTFNEATNIVAHFREATIVNVTFRMHPAGVGRVQECDQTTCEFAAGGSYTFHAEVLDETYEFWDWIVNGQMAGRKNNPILTLNNLNEDVTIDVWFSPLVDDGTIDYLIYGVADEQTGEIDSTIVLGVQEPYRTSVTSIVIPNTTLGVHTIAAHAFDGCTSLESIYIPASVDTVLAYAFANCPALTTIDLSEVDTIGASAFYGCTSLREATLSDNLTVIQDELFYNCSALESITIPASVTSIGNSAFYGCSSLYEIEIPAAVETVGMQAFMGNSNLRIVTVNGGVQSFGEDCFRRSNVIAQTNFNGNFAQWFDIEFENASANPAAHSRNLVVNGEHVNKVVVPEGVETINAYAFYNNTRIDTLVLSANVETIGEEAFFGVANLKRIVIEGNPNEIEVSDNAFDNINKNNVVVEVPCAYIDLTEWHGFTRIIGAGMPVLTLMQRPGGIAKFDETDGIPECGSNPYTYHVIAQASSSYNFVGWSDGFTAPSRYVTLTEDASLAPIFRRKDNVDAVNTKNYDFELPNDPQDWFNIASGDNDWTVGTAVSYLNNHSLYVSKDNGQSCSYNVSNSPYTFTEFKLHSGLYRFSFNYSIGNDIPTNDNLSVAIIPIAENENDEAYTNINPYEEENMPLFIENLTSTEGVWEDAFRLIEIPGEADATQWYRLVFFWNVVSEDNEMVEEIPAVAVDNITLEWMTPKPNQLKKLTATVYVETDDDPEEDMSEQYFVYTWTDQEWIMNRYNNNGDVIRTWNFTEEEALPSPNFEFHYAEHVMIHARVIDQVHYRFVSWNDGNTDPDREISFLDIYGVDPTFIAHFERIPDHLTLSVAMEQGAEQKGTPAIRNSYEIEIEEQPVTVYAFDSETAIDPEVEEYTLVLNEPQAEWAFMGWANENGDTLSTENPFTLQYGQTTFGNVENALDWGRNITIFALMNQLPECPNSSDFDFTNPNFFGRYDFRGRDIDDNDVVSNVEISTRNGQIIVSEANGVEVSLYDVNGRLLETKVDNAQTIYFEVPVSGSYMLKVGNLMTKRIVVVR